MRIHRWSGRHLVKVWLVALAVNALLVLLATAWASSVRPDGLQGLAGMILVLLVARSAVPFGLLLVTLAWYWSRRRVRELETGSPAA